MNYRTAKSTYETAFYMGRNKGLNNCVFPYGSMYESDTFVKVRLHTKLLRQHKRTNIDTAKAYKDIMKRKDMGLLWVSVGRKMRSGDIHPNFDLLLEVKDGNHRLAAHKMLGHEDVVCYMPESHYKYLNSGETND